MRASLMERLDRIDGELGCRFATVTRWPHESDADVRTKIDNWKAGESHEDITGTYTGGDPLIVIVRRFGTVQ